MGERAARGAFGATLAVAVAVCVAAACSSASSPHRAAATTAPAHSTAPAASAWFTAPFATKPNAARFGQDPSFTADGRVLSNEYDPTGVRQVYVSHLDGTSASCLTCGQPGPNGFPQERPQGDWVLFCSYRDHAVNLGSPCLGGYGSELYAMRPDGTHVTRLTAPGMPFETASATYDNYHPYWSPDGTQLVWTHEDFLPISARRRAVDHARRRLRRRRLGHARAARGHRGRSRRQHRLRDPRRGRPTGAASSTPRSRRPVTPRRGGSTRSCGSSSSTAAGPRPPTRSAVTSPTTAPPGTSRHCSRPTCAA